MSRGSSVVGQRWVVKGLFLGMVLLYVALFSTLTILKHEAFETTAFDLGNLDQAVWNTSHGRILRLTNIEGVDTRLAHHVEPILLPISLLYILYSGPQTLLILQTVVIALGAFPVFWLARERLKSDLAGLSFSTAFLLFPALEAANMFDFHAVTLAPSFLLFAFYHMERQRYRIFLLFAVLAMACKEEIPLLISMMGVYLALVKREWKVGSLAIFGGLAWFLAAVYIVIPRFNTQGGSPFLSYYAYLGDGPLEIAMAIVTNPLLILRTILTPAKVKYILDLLLPGAFTSLFSPQTLFLLLPSLAINLLSTYSPMSVLEEFHYAGPLVPFVIISSIYGVEFLVRKATLLRLDGQRSVHLFSGLIFLASLLHHHYHGFTPLARHFQAPVVTAHDRLAHELIALIPPEAAISAQSRLNPHLSERERIYMFPRIEDAHYVFFDVTADSWPIHPNDERALFDSLLEEGFGVLASKDGYILLQRGLPDAQELSSEFYDFARVDSPEIEYPAAVDFGGVLRFLGFGLAPEGKMTGLSLYWQALTPLTRDYRIYPFFYDDAGRIIEDTTLRPMTTALWYPTSRWQRGEVVEMKTLPWDVGDDFNVGLGVMGGEDWRAVEDRLPLEVVTSTLVVSSSDQATALKLLEVRDGRPVTPRRSFEPPSIPNPLQADLAHKVRLLGYDLSPAPLYLGETLHLTLYWQALAKMERDYTVFTHLTDKEGRIWGQKDNFPAGGTRPTSRWLVGEIVVDEYDIPLRGDAPPGEYTIEIGMYDLISGERLAAFDEEGAQLADDRVILTKVEVER